MRGRGRLTARMVVSIVVGGWYSPDKKSNKQRKDDECGHCLLK
jgi:hypothetical protein